MFISDNTADALDNLTLEVVDVERQQITRVIEEILQNLQSLMAMRDFGMELNSEKTIVPLKRDWGAMLIRCDHSCAFRNDFHRV